MQSELETVRASKDDAQQTSEFASFWVAVLCLPPGAEILELSQRRNDFQWIADSAYRIGCRYRHYNGTQPDAEAELERALRSGGVGAMILENAAAAMRLVRLVRPPTAPGALSAILAIEDDPNTRSELLCAFPDTRIMTVAAARTLGRMALKHGAGRELMEQRRIRDWPYFSRATGNQLEL